MAALSALSIAGKAAGIGTGPEQIANLTYRGVYETPVTLENGRYEGPPFVQGGASRPRVMLAEGLRAAGILDPDLGPAEVVVLVETAGGSGSNAYVAVVAEVSGSLENVATRFLGDRVGIRSLVVAEGALVLDLVVAGPQDPACCPTRKVRKTYRLEGKSLREERSEDFGPLSLADLEGTTWRLTGFGPDAPLADGIEVTAIFEEGNISGRSGCNRYFGAVAADATEALSIGPLGATKMLCPEPAMSVETRYLAALQGATRYGFVPGYLVLTYSDADGGGTLLFASY